MLLLKASTKEATSRPRSEAKLEMRVFSPTLISERKEFILPRMAAIYLLEQDL
jgi:hypothetical protein